MSPSMMIERGLLHLDPGTLLLAGIAASGASGILGTISAIQSGRSSAAIEKANAQIAVQKSLAESQQHRLDTIRKLGKTNAAFGGSGVMTSGTPSEVLGDDAVTAGRENELILWGGQSDAIGHQMKGDAARRTGIGQGIEIAGRTAGTVLTGTYSYLKGIK